MTPNQFVQEGEHELVSQNEIIRNLRTQKLCIESKIEALLERRNSFEKRLERWKEKTS